MSKFGIGRTATTIASEDGLTVVTYHGTRVVEFNAHLITLRNGGWMSVTTKRRMNEASATFALDYNVYQVNYEWFVRFAGAVYAYQDRMVLDRATGKVFDHWGDEIRPIE